MATLLNVDRVRRLIVLSVASIACSTAAQDYPNRPVRIIVPTAPGGLMDVPARLAADHLDRALGQRMLVENRSGGGGNLGVEAIAKAIPDGYTIGLIQLGNVAINPFIYKELGFDALNDLVPVAPLTTSPILVVINATVSARTLGEFIALAKREAGKINHGSAGIATVPHFAGELFARMAGVHLTHVHYRGAGPAVTDLVGGQVHVVFVGLGAVRAHLASGKLRALAVAQSNRLQGAPDLPTADEAGLPGYEFTTWFGVAAPKGTPDAIIATLVRSIHAFQDDPAIQKRLADGGMEVLKETSAQFRDRIRRDNERFRDVVKAMGLKPE
ncbi:MAG: Bug family tripartite tricarboxylate transporter substrate binding protein [Burkholderiales bacterium]